MAFIFSFKAHTWSFDNVVRLFDFDGFTGIGGAARRDATRPASVGIVCAIAKALADADADLDDARGRAACYVAGGIGIFQSPSDEAASVFILDLDSHRPAAEIFGFVENAVIVRDESAAVVAARVFSIFIASHQENDEQSDACLFHGSDLDCLMIAIFISAIVLSFSSRRIPCRDATGIALP